MYDTDHEAFARRMRWLGGGPPKSPGKPSKLVASSLTSSTNKIDRLIVLLDAAGSAIGVPPLPNSPLKRPSNKKALSTASSMPALLKPAALPPPPKRGVTVPTKLIRPTTATATRPKTPAAVVPKRGTLFTLRADTRKEVLHLFEAFAKVVNEPQPIAAPFAARKLPGGQPLDVSSKASSVVSGLDPRKLQPTKRSFERVLHLYYPHASGDELQAMLCLIAEPLAALTNGMWAESAKKTFGEEIRKAFAKVDKDGSGGIDVSEFASAVEAADISEQHVREIFEAADANGDGVLDMNEFLNLISTSSVLRPAFGDIMKEAKDKRQRDEYQRLSVIFRDPADVMSAHSPSGRRRRPNLSDLRNVFEVESSLPYHAAAPGAAPAFSPVKGKGSPLKTLRLNAYGSPIKAMVKKATNAAGSPLKMMRKSASMGRFK